MAETDAGAAQVDGLIAHFEKAISRDGDPRPDARGVCGPALPRGVVAATAPSRCRPRCVRLRDGREVTLRAIVESDATEIVQAFERLSAESRHSRFMGSKKNLDGAAVQRGVHPRPGQDFVYVATIPAADGIDIVGAGQYVRAGEGNDRSCEFAITVAEDWRGIGLATRLLARLVRRARRDGYETMEGRVIAQNAPMLAVARKLDFKIEPVSGVPPCCAYGARCSLSDLANDGLIDSAQFSPLRGRLRSNSRFLAPIPHTRKDHEYQLRHPRQLRHVCQQQ